MTDRKHTTHRRTFLKIGVLGGAALLITCYAGETIHRDRTGSSQSGDASKGFQPNAWIAIAEDDTVTVIVNHSEMGQGILTAFAMIVAEELEADWEKMRAEVAPVAPVYVNPAFGVQATGGSTSVKTSWDTLRSAAARTRELLIRAAADTWQVPLNECRAERGRVLHNATHRDMSYGQLIHKAAKMEPPPEPPLKTPDRFTVIGKEFPRLDTVIKARGKAVYGIDFKMPNLLNATMIHPPTLGARLKSFDAAEAKAMPGVRAVTKISTGIAVVADTFHQAEKAARSVSADWDRGPLGNLNSETIRKRWRKAVKLRGRNVRQDGHPFWAFRNAEKTIEAYYELPFQAHVCPEPMNCTAHVKPDGCEIWAPTQNQGGTRVVAAKAAGVHPKTVRVHTTYLGGGFGRRGDCDFVEEAVEISKAVGAPVKLLWTREQDVRNDHYRPGSYHHIKAALGKDGMPVGLSHAMVGPSAFNGSLGDMIPAAIPEWVPAPLRYLGGRIAAPFMRFFSAPSAASAGAATIAYEIPHMRIRYITEDPGVPVGFWRSVANSRNAFVTESFMDEIAVAAGIDPLELRLRLLSKEPRRRGVLELAAGKAGWGKKLPDGVYRGIAVHDFHHTPVAMVAEVSVEDNGTVKIHRIVSAVDCGVVINPRIVQAQISGGIAFGLTAALKSSITFKDGRSEQTNFNNFPILRMEEMPETETHIVPSTEPPGGIGEVGVPPIAPAICNAIYAATGRRIRKLPITADDVTGDRDSNA